MIKSSSDVESLKGFEAQLLSNEADNGFCFLELKPRALMINLVKNTTWHYQLRVDHNLSSASRTRLKLITALFFDEITPTAKLHRKRLSNRISSRSQWVIFSPRTCSTPEQKPESLKLHRQASRPKSRYRK